MGINDEQDVDRGQRLVLCRSAVQSGLANIDLTASGGAGIAHEQPRSELTSTTTTGCANCGASGATG
jgi:hypothetical protein